MNNRRIPTRVWIIILCVLIMANCFVWVQGMKDRYEAGRLDEQTDRYENEIADAKEKSRRTLMTHLLTIDSFMDEVTAIFDKGEFPAGVTAMIAFDGDNMGKKNEQYGESVGTKLCMTFADVVKRHFPDSDMNIVTNVGEKSDEFYMLLMGRESREALIKEIENFQQDIRDSYVLAEDGVTKVSGTVSVGIAFMSEGEEFDVLFDAADQAGYEAKEAGKDCYAVAKD